ncbi:T9SS type A sorting domain-containing protein, partial [Candidatus Marinimicrobia bacterium]|nr:T9SS type A sorting domain-containing protein [Candidatus Neomarinimicrobiota bacterium]
DGFCDGTAQQYGADLCCFDNDGGDCTEAECDGSDTSTTTTTTTGGTADCDDCELDWSAYGSECCDTAWVDFGIDCATLTANYGWDCAGCNCPGDSDPVCGDGVCNGDETFDSCPEDCNAPGECDAGYISDCVDDDCCPESWIGDGFEDCEDQAYGCDLTCYDNDGGDCPEACDEYQCWDGSCVASEDDCPDEPEIEAPTEVCSEGTEYSGYPSVTVTWFTDGTGTTTTTTTTGGTADCDDCELDWTAYGSECCDTAAVDFGIDCATLEGTYGWDCSGCNCPLDGEAVCGDGNCTGDESYDTCPEDCLPAGDCADGQVADCADDDCHVESWVGDGFCDGTAQQYGADLCCFDNDGGDCTEAECDGSDTSTTTTTTTGGTANCDDCELDWTAYGSECCDTAWVDFGIDCATLTANYGWDCAGCNCPGDNGRSNVKDVPQVKHLLGSMNTYSTDANVVSIDDDVLTKLDPQTRNDIYVVDLSCDACLDGGPWSGSFDADPSLGEFTVYGFDGGSLVIATLTSCTLAGACSDAVGPMSAYAGANDGVQDCAEGGGDPCDGQGAGDSNNDGTINVLDVVGIVNDILAGGGTQDECATAASDYNSDGTVNVLDVVAIVNIILSGGGRTADATEAKMTQTDNSMSISADGYIGGVQMTLSHSSDFSIELTDNAYIAEYKTASNSTTLMIINPEGEEMFTFSGDFEVEEVLVTNSEEFINVVNNLPIGFSLSNAYPNPFNPSTTIELNLSDASYASVKVFNLKGEVVGVLMDGMVDASSYTMTWNASNLSSGVYMIKAEANGHIATQKVMLVK